MVFAVALLSTAPLLLAQASAPIAERLSAIVARLESGDAAKVEAADVDLDRLCFEAGRPGAEGERKALAAAIAGRLSSEIGAAAKLLLLRRLETLGKAEVVPALAKLLREGADVQLQDAARRALEANPAPGAKSVLRDALATTSGSVKAAVCRSLGERRDFLAVGPLLDAAQSGEGEVRVAAVEALAAIGDEQCVPVVEKAVDEMRGRDLAAARRAYLRLAHELAANGDRGMARRIYGRLATMGPELAAAALIGAARAELQSEVPKIVEALEAGDAEVRGAAWEAALAFQGAAMTKALAARLQTAGGELRIDLVRLIAERRDPEALDAMLAVAMGPDPAVRAIAAGALGVVEASRALPVLLDALAAEDEVSGAAERALRGLSGEGVAAAIAARVEGAPAKVKAPLLRVLAVRGGPEAGEVAAALAVDADPSVRTEAFRALAASGGRRAFGLILSALLRADEKEIESLARALRRVEAEGKDAAVLAAYRRAGAAAPSSAQRAALLSALGRSADAALRPVLVEAVGDSDEAVAAAAVDALASTADPALVSTFQSASRRDSERVRESALAALLAAAQEIQKTDPARAGALYADALERTRRADLQARSLRGLAEVGSAEALAKIEPFLKPGPLQRDAGRAALELASRLPEDRRGEAEGVLRRLIALEIDEATLLQAVRRLRRLGVDVDPAREQGFITHWWIAGPLPNPGGSLWGKALEPESGVDVSRALVLDAKEFAWTRHHTPHPRGFVLLDQVFAGRSDEAGAYLYAEVSAESESEVLFKLGSDDQIACWLNGVQVHAHRASRGLDADQDTVRAKLAAGSNRIVLKVLNDGGGWGACLRVTDLGGRPLKLKQREE